MGTKSYGISLKNVGEKWRLESWKTMQILKRQESRPPFALVLNQVTMLICAMQMKGVQYEMEKGGFILHPHYPWLAASLDYVQLQPSFALVEIKYTGRELPETTEECKKPDTDDMVFQVTMQQAIWAAKHGGHAGSIFCFHLS